MPAEWESHAATWMAWPHNPATWPGRMEAILPIWIEMIRGLEEPVHLLVNDDAMRAEAAVWIKDSSISPGKVRYHTIPTDDVWIRDTGPTFVRSERGSGFASSSERGVGGKESAGSTGGRVVPPNYNDAWIRDTGPTFVKNENQLSAVNWIYNCWGEKYPPWDRDREVARRMTEACGLKAIEAGFVLEGGSIEVNGSGTLITTEQCLLNPNRNPHLSRTRIEERLRSLLGVRKIIWLGEGIAGDDTDGHVDDIARFVDSRTVVVAAQEDMSDANYSPLYENYEILTRETDEEGRPLKVVTLPMPDPVVHEGNRLPASYANFYIANGVVLAPVFGDPHDRKAREILRKLFPGRRVVPIPSRDLVIGLGSIHCLTQQQPG